MNKTKLLITSSPLVLALLSMFAISRSCMEVDKKRYYTDAVRRLMMLGMATACYYYEAYLNILMFFMFETLIGMLNEKLWEDRYRRMTKFYDRLIECIRLEEKE